MQTESMSQQQEYQLWSNLQTVSTFDAGTADPIAEMEDNVVFDDLKCFSPTSLLVESLIEQLCKLLEKNPTDQKKLYHVICQKLHKMDLIDETYEIEEFEFIRSHYQKALVQLLSVAKSTVSKSRDSNVLIPLPSKLSENAPSFESSNFLEWSRYHTEFVEMDYIARGGFGQVYKAKHILDGEEYAIKKICLRYQNMKSFLVSIQEVKLLARLNHPNIVSYKAAWLEPLEVQDAPRNPYRKIINKSSHHTLESVTSDDSVIFKCSETKQIYEVSCNKETRQSNNIFEFSSSFHNDVNTDCDPNLIEDCCTSENISKMSQVSMENAVCELKKDNWCMFHTKGTQHLHDWAMLYIQMQLCDLTLRQWLDDRNALAKSVDMLQSISIFKQIVSGVQYIHSKNIVHHDIKPSNIFVSRDMSQIQVGDFGLACFLQHSSDDVTLVAHDSTPIHKGHIGTKLYAAPEQVEGECNPRSDLYSLGIILFELLNIFSTDMERSKCISDLKLGNISPDFFPNFPKLKNIILRLLLPDPDKRPTASELLVNIEDISHNLVTDNASQTNETVRQLLSVISEKDREIQELKLKLQALQTSK